MPNIVDLIKGGGTFGEIGGVNLKDFNGFVSNYDNLKSSLTSRTNKKFEKEFREFLENEDAYLRAMCALDERRSDALNNSATKSLSFCFRRFEEQVEQGKAERYQADAERLKLVVGFIKQDSLLQGLLSEKGNKEKSRKPENSELKLSYVKRRLAIYNKVNVYSKQSDRALRRMKRNEAYFEAYRDERERLLSKFANEHKGVLDLVELKDGFDDYALQNSRIGDLFTNQSESDVLPLNETLNQLIEQKGDELENHPLLGKLIQAAADTTLKEKIKNKEAVDDLLIEGKSELYDLTGPVPGKASVDSLERAKMALVTEALNEVDTLSQRNSTGPNSGKLNAMKARRFKDRIFTNFGLQWIRGTSFLPTGCSPNLGLGYQLTQDGSIQFNVFNQLSWIAEEQTEEYGLPEGGLTITSLSGRIMADQRIWKFIFLIAGLSYSLPQLELSDKQGNNLSSGYLSCPIGIVAVNPIGKNKDSVMSLTYEAFSPGGVNRLNFNVGFQIGRR